MSLPPVSAPSALDAYHRSSAQSSATTDIVGISLEVLSSSYGDSRTLEFRKTTTPVVSIGRRPAPREGTVSPIIASGDAATFRCPVISRRHAQIAYSNAGEVYVLDLKSHHGTWVQKAGQSSPARIVAQAPVILSNNDVVTFGKPVYKENDVVEPIAVRVRLLYDGPMSSPVQPRIQNGPSMDSITSGNTPSPSGRRQGRYGLNIPSSFLSDSSPSSSDDDEIQEIPAPYHSDRIFVDLTTEDGELNFWDGPRSIPSVGSSRMLETTDPIGHQKLPFHIPGLRSKIQSNSNQPLGTRMLPFTCFSSSWPATLVDLTRDSEPGSPSSPPNISAVSYADMELDSEVEELSAQTKPLENVPKDTKGSMSNDGNDSEDDLYADDGPLPQPRPALVNATLPRVERSVFQNWLSPDGELLPPPPPLPSVEDAIRALGGEPEWGPHLAPLLCEFEETCVAGPELSAADNQPGCTADEPLFSPEPQTEVARSPSPDSPTAETVDAPKPSASTDSSLVNDLAKLHDAATYAKNNIIILQSHRRRVKSRLARQAQDVNDKLLAINGRFADFEQDFKFALDEAEHTIDHRFGTLHQMAEDHSREMEDILDRVADLECSLMENDEREEARSKDITVYEEQLQQLMTTTAELRDATKQLFDAELAAMRKARAEVAAASLAAQVLPGDHVEPSRDSLKRKRSVEDVDGDQETETANAAESAVENTDLHPVVIVADNAERPRKRLRSAAKAVAHTVAAAAVGALATVVILSLD